jgi:hypothetical protein
MKENEIMSFAGKWRMELEMVMLSEKARIRMKKSRFFLSWKI